jgi:hypothetical protein
MYSVLLTGVLSAKETVLVLHPPGQEFETTAKGLSESIQEDYIIRRQSISENMTKEKLAEIIDEIGPKIIVLMDNQAITLYKQYQKSLADTSLIIPSISVMGILIDKAISGLKNAAGITYEIPLVTGAVSLRAVLKDSIFKIGVIYREFMKGFIQQNITYCQNEKIKLVPVLVPDGDSKRRKILKKGLKNLLRIQQVDAIWVPNDNILLSPDLIQGVWRKFLKKYKTPVIVGVEILVNPKLEFGTLAVLPDHRALGSQAAELVIEARENNWRFEDLKTEPAISVIKVLNLKRAVNVAETGFRGIQTVDKVLE